MATTTCGTCTKIVLFIVNLIFWIIGIALLGVGIWVSIDRTTVEFLLLFDDPLFRAVGFAAIAIGGIVTILGFLGCFGACHESHWMLWTYFVVVLILFLAEVVCLALTFAYKNEVEMFVSEKLDDSVQKNYGMKDYPGVTKAIDQLQMALECCGNTNFTNYETSKWYTEMSERAVDQNVPCSCCLEPTVQERCQVDFDSSAKCQKSFSESEPDFRWENGCYDALYNKIMENIWVIGGIGIGEAILQVLLMILAVILLRNIEDDYE